jgi:tRNA (guanine37-N1)-methyltransferase
MLKINIISIFPEYLKPLQLSLLGKAQEKGLINIDIHDLRKHTSDVHHSVDDTPYGGGAGMVMSPEPWGLAIDEITNDSENFDLIVLTPAGKKFDQKMAGEFAAKDNLIFRMWTDMKELMPESLNIMQPRRISPFMKYQLEITYLGGGEVATMVIVEAVVRLIPGVLGNPDSLKEESHTLTNKDGSLVEYPNYTKPASWRGLEVPSVLLSGNHGEIEKWRLKEAERRTHGLTQE